MAKSEVRKADDEVYVSPVVNRFCPNCGLILPEEHTGICPNCGCSTKREKGELYRLSPNDLKTFDRLDRKGGVLKWHKP